jgi:hypothetical protein
MLRAPFFPEERRPGLAYQGMKKIRQGVYRHDDNFSAGGKQKRRAADKIFQHGLSRFCGDIGKNEVPAGAGGAREEGFGMGLQNRGRNAVGLGVVGGKKPGQFIPVLGPDVKTGKTVPRPVYWPGGFRRGRRLRRNPGVRFLQRRRRADGYNPGAAARVQNPPGRGVDRGPVFIPQAGKGVKKQRRPPVYAGGAEKSVGKGKPEFHAPELKRGYF